MIYTLGSALVIGFLFTFVAGCRVLFMIADKPWRVCVFSWGITATWVWSANVAVESPWYVIIVFGVGCMFGNLVAMRYAKRSNHNNSMK